MLPTVAAAVAPVDVAVPSCAPLLGRRLEQGQQRRRQHGCDARDDTGEWLGVEAGV
jgi:hypothetical protein